MKSFLILTLILFGSVGTVFTQSRGIQLKMDGNFLMVLPSRPTDLLTSMVWSRCDKEICSYMAHGTVQIEKQPPLLIKKILAIKGVDCIVILSNGALSIKKTREIQWAKISRPLFDILLKLLPDRQNLTAMNRPNAKTPFKAFFISHKKAPGKLALFCWSG